ncbi:MAG: DUF1116 domain-containing protein [Alphaproteobacteria bacterium]|nr:DUF1116 domain-containing protein [Alphaproteobacteria bacterium]
MTVLNLGVADFARPLSDAETLDWRPPGDGDPGRAWRLARLMSGSAAARIDAANRTAMERVLAAQPVLVDIALHARDVWPDLGRRLLHAGPPIPWQKMCAPMQGAAIGAVIYEGWAEDAKAAEALLASGAVPMSPCHDRAAVGPMAGIVSSSMPLWVARNADRGNLAYTNFSEGIGRVLRFGANGPDVIERLRWVERVLAPGLKAALARIPGGVNLKSIQSQALLMGDEVHSRNAAATMLFLQQIAAPLFECSIPAADKSAIHGFIAATGQFFLNLSMVAAKAIMDAGHGVADASLVTAMARNGVNVGIRVSGLGQAWFEAPAGMPDGLYFPGFKPGDANPDLGDSAITETAGYGGFSLAASPALVQLVGGTVEAAFAASREMLHITLGRNPAMTIPALDFGGAPIGIDPRKVVDSGIRPIITTGMAHRQAGIGQVGAGIVRAPMGCFLGAIDALAAKLGVA